MNRKPPAWLEDAVFYEIYPQSFYDSNGDGIGDLNGIIQKLDYIKGLGFNALWLNPCFVSPFDDAGYDVQDYLKIAPRYGTNADARRLFSEAKKRGMHVLLDLVPGHTSWQHDWFKQSSLHKKTKFDDYFIWTGSVWEQPGPGLECVRGLAERDSGYVTSFFCSQPALNYGFARPDPKKSWQHAMNHPAPRRVTEAMKKVMRFWLDMGASGFRVDMAGAMIKGDPNQKATISFWRKVTADMQRRYPQAVLVSEWSKPSRALRAGFDIDFMIHFGTDAFSSLFKWGEKSFFSKSGKGEARTFLKGYLAESKGTERMGYISIPSGNHDMSRLAEGRNLDELKACFAFLLTAPGIPFVYYGDEIGMDVVNGLASKEGGYGRTGSRTPMQWSAAKNAGFSKAAASRLYLPVDKRPKAPHVAKQEGDPKSLLELVRKLNSLRHSLPALQAGGAFKPLYFGSGRESMVFIRESGKQRILVAIHPCGRSSKLKLRLKGAPGLPLFEHKMRLAFNNGSATLSASGTGFGIYDISTFPGGHS